MVKHIFIDIDDEEFEEFKRLKGNRTWKQVLIDGLKAGEKK